MRKTLPVPSAKTPLRREARLARIAGSLASGATVTEIAAAEGISRAMASHEANSLACRQLIADFVNHEHELMLGLFYRAVRAVEEALSATREYTTKGGQVFSGGPDHYARLAATKHLREFLSAGRPAAKPVEERTEVTLEEFQRLLEKAELQDEESRQSGPSKSV